MNTNAAKTAYENLLDRVTAVAALHRRTEVSEAAGRITWRIGLPLLAVTVLHLAVSLPFYLRAPVIPLVIGALVVWGWFHVAKPLLVRYTTTRAAMLVEARRPDLRTRVVSALELYPDLESGRPRFDREMVEATVVWAQRTTEREDFLAVIDRRPAKRQLLVAALTLVLWVGAFVYSPMRMWQALAGMGRAWNEMGDVMRKIAGARIEVDPLDSEAYLLGSSVRIRAWQKGFRRGEMILHVRSPEGAPLGNVTLPVDAEGRSEHVFRDVDTTFQFHLSSGRIESGRHTVIVTERPRIVTISVEYDLPEYVRRAPVVQPRSDGNLRALYGSSVVLTIEANKKLARAELSGSFLKEREDLALGGRYARGVIRLDDRKWLSDSQAVVEEFYSLRLTDSYGFENLKADHRFQLAIVKDSAPEAAFVGLPHRSPAHEPHVLEESLDTIGLAVKVSDDYGVRKVVLRCRIESLETDRELRSEQKEKQFGVPVAQLPRLSLFRLSDLGAKVGERIVFWAEAEDAYDLEPDRGPNRVRTPTYRVAVVTQEELFAAIRYKDTWSVPWYDKQKIATLSKREAPARQAPEREDPAKVAAKLLDAAPSADALRSEDRRVVERYYENLNVE